MKKVLYIEDNDINIVIFEASLEGMVILETALNGYVGIEKASQQTFDLIVIDLNLNDSEMDGFEVLKRLKNDYAGTKHTRFYAYTSYEGEEWRKKCLEAGFDAYFPKPVPPDELLEHYEQHYH